MCMYICDRAKISEAPVTDNSLPFLNNSEG
jgi:hypothetical protein